MLDLPERTGDPMFNKGIATITMVLATTFLAGSASAYGTPALSASGMNKIAEASSRALPLRACPEAGKIYYSESHSSVYLGDTSTRTFGSAGGQLSLAIGRSVSTTGSLSTSTTVEADAVFAKVSASVGLQLSLSSSNSITQSYTWTVPMNQSVGWIEAGHQGYRVKYQKYTYVTPCTYKLLKQDTIIGSTPNIRFTHS